MAPIVYFSTASNFPSSEAFFRKVLGTHLGLDTDQLRICRSAYGKPFLEGHSGIHFNISHAAGAIVCAVSERPVGIDMERKRKINFRIMNRFFTENERAFVLTAHNDQDERFTHIWTMKESYVKYTGKGFAECFEGFDVLEMEEMLTFCQGSNIKNDLSYQGPQQFTELIMEVKSGYITPALSIM
jgi:4'-phosphopantetheinyl transferase